MIVGWLTVLVLTPDRGLLWQTFCKSTHVAPLAWIAFTIFIYSYVYSLPIIFTGLGSGICCSSSTTGLGCGFLPRISPSVILPSADFYFHYHILNHSTSLQLMLLSCCGSCFSWPDVVLQCDTSSRFEITILLTSASNPRTLWAVQLVIILNGWTGELYSIPCPSHLVTW